MNENQQTVLTAVRCPNCRTSVEWKPENAYRPFCSRRCRLIDLGEWATEQYTIAAEEDEMFSEEMLR